MSTDKQKIVKKVPDATPELIEDHWRHQDHWRSLFRAPEVSRDAYAESVIISNLKILDSMRASIRRSNNQTKRALARKMREIRHETAVWLSSIGQFEAAEKLSYQKEKRAHFRELKKAVERDDAAWCEHGAFEYVDGQLSQIAYRETDFYSKRHGRVVSMIRCNKCGFRNAVDLPSDLKKLSAFREAATSAARDITTEFVPKTLAANHLSAQTIEEILK